MNSLGESLSACAAGVFTARGKKNVGASSTPLHAPVMVKPGAYMVLPRSSMLVGYIFFVIAQQSTFTTVVRRGY